MSVGVATPFVPKQRTIYGGDNPCQLRLNFLAIEEPTSVPRPRLRGMPLFNGGFQPPATASKTRCIRDGPHVGHNKGFNPLQVGPLDPLALQQLKVKNPVEYHVYQNQRPWVTQSKVIGEHARSNASSKAPRLPPTPPPNSDVRSFVLSFSDAARISTNPAYAGFYPTPPRTAGGAITETRGSYQNPRVHPEPAGCKVVDQKTHPFQSFHPTDTSARDALDSIFQPDGTLVKERPPLVHASVWDRVNKRADAAKLENPHAHKTRKPFAGGTLTGYSSLSLTGTAAAVKQ